MPPKVFELTDENFEGVVLGADRPVLVEFGAPWCGPCRTLEPTVEELAVELSGRLRVARVHVDDERPLAARYEVFSIPTLLLFVNGVVRRRIIGAQPKRRLLEELEEHLPAAER